MSHSPSSSSLSPRSAGDVQINPLLARRERSLSQCERALQYPSHEGIIQDFCREKGHGHIKPRDNSESIFVHVSDIEDDYVPKAGDVVSYKKILMPPKNEKYQAIHVRFLQLSDGVKHESWEEAVQEDVNHRRPSVQDGSVTSSYNDQTAPNGDHIHRVNAPHN
ncbi:unnamed protein product [Didymodactylos carnosus]|uniref:CSD domain-containing protein n=1 Tax=Didymodactylos carnosus TaxID=1234261 RepID=A0A813ZZ71_9BILA|nr:unnamed protein product [Didymodactylos carnosus]CAF0905169.1 unnamed protein product [Didymodactylos carnosus]CAF3515514.1 unnamed protein product [Didymodactylos carnosus]CAF3687033.1 unnamed protein product [Didymodactylos carnosus]